jgi:uncharacterized protein (TIGR02266 family)
MNMLWLRPSRTVLIVSRDLALSSLDTAFLHQPHIRLLTTLPDWRGLYLARRKQPSLIIEDVRTSDGDLAFSRDLREDPKTSSIPLILVAEPELQEEAGRTKADALLARPLARRAYYDAVRRFIPMPNRRSRRIPINLRFSWSHEGRVVQAFSRDVSQEGAFIKSDRALPIGSRILVHFSLPGTSEVLNCEAVVRYGSPPSGCGQMAGFGIEFEGLSDRSAELLEAFVESKLQRHRVAR